MATTELDIATGELVHLGSSRLTPTETRERANWVREVTKAALTENVDYGIIPGTDKPALLKPGAEMLLLAAGLGFEIEKIEDDDSRNHQGVTYRCTVKRGDFVVSECDGYAGYDESRFFTSGADAERKERANAERYQRPVNKAKFTEYRAPWNSVIKMAQKRAFVGAALNAVAGSGLFTQDIEDDIPATPVSFNGHTLMEPFLKQLDATSKKELGDWRKAEGLPASNEMSAEQAARALVKIGELLARQERLPEQGEGVDGSGGKGSPAPAEDGAQGGTTQADEGGEPGPEPTPTMQGAGRPEDLPDSSAASGPGTTSRKISQKQAQRLHVIAGDLDETTLRVIIFGATAGTSDSAKDVTLERYDALCGWIENAKAGTLPSNYADVAAEYVTWRERQEAAR